MQRQKQLPQLPTKEQVTFQRKEKHLRVAHIQEKRQQLQHPPRQQQAGRQPPQEQPHQQKKRQKLKRQAHEPQQIARQQQEQQPEQFQKHQHENEQQQVAQQHTQQRQHEEELVNKRRRAVKTMRLACVERLFATCLNAPDSPPHKQIYTSSGRSKSNSNTNNNDIILQYGQEAYNDDDHNADGKQGRNVATEKKMINGCYSTAAAPRYHALLLPKERGTDRLLEGIRKARRITLQFQKARAKSSCGSSISTITNKIHSKCNSRGSTTSAKLEKEIANKKLKPCENSTRDDVSGSWRVMRGTGDSSIRRSETQDTTQFRGNKSKAIETSNLGINGGDENAGADPKHAFIRKKKGENEEEGEETSVDGDNTAGADNTEDNINKSPEVTEALGKKRRRIKVDEKNEHVGKGQEGEEGADGEKEEDGGQEEEEKERGRLLRTLFVGNLPLEGWKKTEVYRHLGIERKDVESDAKDFQNAYIVLKERSLLQPLLKKDGETFKGRSLRVDAAASRGLFDRKKSIFVGNLPPRCSEEELRNAASVYGQVRGVRIVRDSVTSTCKGFGFVCYADRMSVARALLKAAEDTPGLFVQGRELRVTRVLDEASSRKADAESEAERARRRKRQARRGGEKRRMGGLSVAARRSWERKQRKLEKRYAGRGILGRAAASRSAAASSFAGGVCRKRRPNTFCDRRLGSRPTR